MLLPAAHSDGDSAVRFDRADAVVAGAVFDPTRFPVIDLAHGGSIQGEIDALSQLLNTLVFGHTPVLQNTGGTVVIPMRGPLQRSGRSGRVPGHGGDRARPDSVLHRPG